ncbi:xylulokinase [Kineococcus aurantiacus]|uniref:Xylulose kinase n=1 Tax=Kineococcus aurantiacus TaxID=37633 RepID=A0A7Y9DMK6_9ACTN|nr:xylulokinase [Kineococcus aurantiacus]NYD23355.1 xylulokinase [Kineococcus aurantiacus]
MTSAGAGGSTQTVAGIDSSTQSCKVVVRDAATGALLRVGRAQHPDGTEVDPAHWWRALERAVDDAGGLDDVDAIAVGAQQHGSVLLDEDGEVVRPALLWNDGRSAAAAEELTAELGGPGAWAEQVGSVLVASLTITKLRWIAEHEPETVARTAAVCLPHDWLTHELSGRARLVTDRGDASGTGYWSPREGAYREDLLHKAFGATPNLPEVLAPAASAGVGASPLSRGALLGAGTGDNMAAALGVGAQVGDVVVSIGTSGVVSVVSDLPTSDPSGLVAGFADATGRYLPLVCTLNAARVLDAAARMLGVDHAELSRLALSAPAGSGGLVLVPYLEGERTPVRPDATGALHGLTLATSTPAHVARATVEGLLCGLADGLDALADQGCHLGRVVLVGGGARSEAVRVLAPAVLGRPVVVPEPGEYVADGAARQAAWVLSGGPTPPQWSLGRSQTFEADPLPGVRERYAEVRDLTATRR